MPPSRFTDDRLGPVLLAGMEIFLQCTSRRYEMENDTVALPGVQIGFLLLMIKCRGKRSRVLRFWRNEFNGFEVGIVSFLCNV